MLSVDGTGPVEQLLPPSDGRPSPPWRVAIVDDDPPILRALSGMLTANRCRVSVFSSAVDFLRSLHGDLPEVLLVDLCLPGIDGLQLQAMLHEHGRHFPVVFLSGHADVATSVLAVRNGAVDFLVKPCSEETLLRSLEYAIGIARRVDGRESALQRLSAAYRSLTNRERVVFGWVVTGRLNKQIASAIGTVEKTVKVHRARVMTKMGATSIVDLVRMFDTLSDAAVVTQPNADMPVPLQHRATRAHV
jgi:FixJ family two-component response regulator